MLNDEAKFIIDALASGVDPVTGEILSTESIFNQPSVIRALFLASRALENVEKKEESGKLSPGNAGNPWSDIEDAELLVEFNKGLSVKEIATKHDRTQGAITSRLLRLGVGLKTLSDGGSVTANNIEDIAITSQTFTLQDAKESETPLLEDLKAEIEDSHKIVSQKDCDDFINSISKLLESINDLNMRGNAKRRIRELESIRPTLPSEKEANDNDFVIHGLKRLKSHAPKCVKCGLVMLLQQNNKTGSKSKGEYFWGCQNFALPFSDLKHCGLTKQLTVEERAEITPGLVPIANSSITQKKYPK
jgi:hypothetical protein